MSPTLGLEQRVEQEQRLLVDEDIGYEVLDTKPAEGYKSACIVRPISIERPTDLEVRLAVGEQLQHDLSNVFTGPMATVARLLWGETGNLKEVQTSFKALSAALSIVRNLSRQQRANSNSVYIEASEREVLATSAKLAGRIVQRIDEGRYIFLPHNFRYKLENLGQICALVSGNDVSMRTTALENVSGYLGTPKGDRPSPAVGLYVGNSFDDTLRAIAETGEYEHHASGLDRIILLGMKTTLDHLNGVTSALKYLVTDEQRAIAPRIYDLLKLNIEDLLVSTLRLREEGELRDEEKDELTGVYQTIQKLERHLKAIQQLTGGEERVERFSPRRILEEIGAYFNSKFNLGFRNGSCTLSGDAADLLCTGYGPSMTVLWHNFVSNALDATFKAGRAPIVNIDLSITRTNDIVDFRYCGVESGARYDPDSPFVRVSVTDQGTGIPAKILPIIFRPGVTTKAADSGIHGVGLGLSAPILDRTDSYIRVDTAEGHGTRVTTYTPLVHARAN